MGRRDHCQTRLGSCFTGDLTNDERLVLPAEVLVLPVESVPSTLLADASWSPGDCAVIRPALDTPASVVSEGAAALLQEFRVSQTVPDALRRLARAYDLEPEAIAEDALSLIQQLVEEGLLI